MPAAPPITIAAFQGEQPRVIPRLMPDTAAQSAVDSRLDDGGLTPFRESVVITSLPDSGQHTIYFFQSTWLSWPGEVDVAPGPVAADRIYYTGDGPPKMRVGTGTSDVYSLAVPRPSNPPSPASGSLLATLTGPAATAGADIQSRLYIYTFVTDINGVREESEPSLVSNSVDWQTPRTVTLTNLQVNATRGINARRIYRLQTGSAGSYYYFVKEIDNTVTTYIDDTPIDASAEPCPSISYNAPPSNLLGLTAMPAGMMAAFTGKKLYFCEPWRPHAWPEKYVLTTDYDIVALGAMGMSLLVTTKGQPYLVSGTRPDAMAMQKIEQNLPCINSRSMVDLGYAVAFASNEGLVVARADGSISLATSNIFNRRDWEELTPTGMIGAQFNGRYVAFYNTLLDDGTRDTGALFVDLAGASFLIRSDSDSQAAWYDLSTSSLYYVPLGKAQIRQIDAPGALPKFLYWKSKEFVLPYPENYGAFMIDGIVTPEEIDPDKLATQIAAIVAANKLLIEARYTTDDVPHQLISIGGDINSFLWSDWSAPPPPIPPAPGGVYNRTALNPRNPMLPGEVAVNGDVLTPLPRGARQSTDSGESTAGPGDTTVTVGIYADKQKVFSVTQANKAVRLPSGFRARTWEMDVYTNGRVHKITMTKTMDDLKRTP
jgi:hypothetical protein